MKIRKIILSVMLLFSFFTSQAFAYEINADYNSQTFNFVVEGKTSSGDFGKPISVLLTNKENNSVGHIGMTEVNSDGSYIYKFYFDGDVSDYNLKVRLDGTDLTGTLINKIEAFTDLVLMDVKLTNENGKPFSFSTDTKLNFNAVLKNAFESNTQFTAFGAFYDENGRLLSCKSLFDGTVDFFDFEKSVSKNDIEVPQGSKNLKIMCFKGLSSMKPLNNANEIKNGSGLELFVSPDGSESGDGSIESPFATITQAKNYISTLKNEGTLPKGEITVYFKGGKYFFDNTVAFTAKDSGTKDFPITYKAYGNEKVVFTGGKYLSGADFTAVDSGDAMFSKISESVRNSVKKVNLTDKGIAYVNDYVTTGESVSGGVSLLKTEIFVDGEACNLARWPNVNENKSSQFVTSTDVDTNSKDSTTKPVLEISSDTYNKINSWSNKTEAFCEGWFGQQYDFESVKVDSIQTGKKYTVFGDTVYKLTLEKGVRGGFYPQGTNDKNGKRNKFYFSNVIEELDSPYEYYVDRTNGVLYFYPPESFSENSEIGIPQSDKKMLTLYDGADYINFDGITFELNKEAHLCIDNSKNITVKNCDFINSSYESVVIDHAYRRKDENKNWLLYGTIDNDKYEVVTKNITVENCTFRNLGKGAIISSGGSLNSLERANYTVKNCVFDSCDRIRKNYAPAIKFIGVGLNFTNNLVENQFGQGIEVSGSDIYVAYNEFSNVAKEASDCGAIYSQNFSLGVDIYNNYFHDISYSSNMASHNKTDNITDHTQTVENKTVSFKPAVYIDGCSVGGNIQNNIFENLPVGAVLQSYGQALKNNIFIDVPMLLYTTKNVKASPNLTTNNLWTDTTTKPLATIKDNATVQNVWYTQYPHASEVIAKLNERSNANVGYPIIDVKDNLIFYHSLTECVGVSDLSKVVWDYDILTNSASGNIVENNIFETNTNIFEDFENKNFNVPVMEKAFDLTKIDINKMGVNK